MLQLKYRDGSFERKDEKELTDSMLVEIKALLKTEMEEISFKLNLVQAESQQLEQDELLETKTRVENIKKALLYRQRNLEIIEIEQQQRREKNSDKIEFYFMKAAQRLLPGSLYVTVYEESEKMLNKSIENFFAND